MFKDFSPLERSWRERLTTLSTEDIPRFDLDAVTISFLTTVGLPGNLNDLEHALEINFYFTKEKLITRTFRGVSYLIIGDDSGTHFSISSHDKCVYAVDFTESFGSDPVCFVNSNVEKFVRSIFCFVDFKKESKNTPSTERELIELMKAQLGQLDERAMSSSKTWWRQIIDDPIKG